LFRKKKLLVDIDMDFGPHKRPAEGNLLKRFTRN